jgi:hypothetical protein
LITLSHVVGFDETTLRAGPAGTKRYVLSAVTELYSLFGLGGRDLDSFRDFDILPDFTGIAVHDRYQNYLRHEAPRHIPNTVGKELGGRFLGLMADLDPKGEGDRSMSGKQRSCSGV